MDGGGGSPAAESAAWYESPAEVKVSLGKHFRQSAGTP